MTGTDEEFGRDGRAAGRGAAPGLRDVRAGSGVRAAPGADARDGGDGPLLASVRAGAYALGVGVGKARRALRHAAGSPAARRAGDGLRVGAAKAGVTVVPAARNAAQGAYDATDKLLRELGSKCDEAARASEVGRRAPAVGQGAAAGARTAARARGAAEGHAVDGVRAGGGVSAAGREGPGGQYAPDPAEEPPLLGPVSRRVAGLLLVLAGVPMLVLPGPGVATIITGVAMMRGDRRHGGPIAVDARDLRDAADADE